ncbi:MAG TPA: hypothetical protein DF712_06160 [Balneola sp.]|nr:hypothetical protein [Balneola sp.]
MGIFADIGLRNAEGEVDSTGIIDQMISIAETGSPNISGVPLGLSIPEGDLDHFKPSNGIEAHKEQFQQFHKINIEFYKKVVAALDVEAVNVLKSIGVTDPTQPIVDFTKQIKENFEPLLPGVDDVELVVLSKIDVVLASAEPITEFFNEVRETDPEELSDLSIEPLTDVLEVILEGNLDSDQIQALKDKIEEEKEDLLGTLQGSLPELSEVEIPVPDLTAGIPNPIIPVEAIGLLEVPNVDPTKLIETLMSEGPPPGVLKFITDFFKKMMEEVMKTIGLMSVPGAVQTEFVFTVLPGGIQAIIDFFMEKVLGPIVGALRDSFPGIEEHIIPASFFAALLLNVIKMIIVVIVGILLGSGLVAFGIGKALGLI